MRIAVDALAVRSTSHGVGRYTLGLLGGLLAANEDHEYVVFVRDDAADVFAHLRPFIALERVRARPALRVAWEQFGLPLALRRHSADVLLGTAFVVPLVRACPQVVVIHDMTWFLLPEVHTVAKRQYFTRMIPLAMRSSRRIISVSESTGRDIGHRFPWARPKVRVVLEGVDHDAFHPIDRRVARARVAERFGLRRPFILSIGVPEPRKNLDVIVEAFTSCATPDAQLVLVGHQSLGWNNQRLRRTIAAARPGSVILLDGVGDADLPYLLNACELFTYVPDYEGFGLPVLEALACGTPTVTTRVASLPEVGGSAVTYVAPRDARDLGAAIAQALQKADRQVDAGALEQARRFTWQACAAATLSVLSEAAG